MLYFSKDKGFQRADMHGDIPPHAKLLTEKQHHDLMVAQMRGCKITQQPNGAIVAVEPAAPTLDVIKKAYTRYASPLVDDVAKQLGFDNARDCISFVGDPNPEYHDRAVAFRAWRSAFWTEFDKRFNYDHPMSQSAADILPWVATLPKWPGMPVVETENEIDPTTEA